MAVHPFIDEGIEDFDGDLLPLGLLVDLPHSFLLTSGDPYQDFDTSVFCRVGFDRAFPAFRVSIPGSQSVLQPSVDWLELQVVGTGFREGLGAYRVLCPVESPEGHPVLGVVAHIIPYMDEFDVMGGADPLNLLDMQVGVGVFVAGVREDDHELLAGGRVLGIGVWCVLGPEGAVLDHLVENGGGILASAEGQHGKGHQVLLLEA